MPEFTSTEDVVRVLKDSRVVAVLGAHPSTFRPAYYVPEYLKSQGYEILPVNATKAGEPLFDHTIAASLADLKRPVDVVDVFRRADQLQGHLGEILAMDPRPKLVWLQLGIRNDAFAKALTDEGIDVIQDRCMLADHKAFAVGPVGA